MITTQDKELLAKKGITEEQIAEQLACFQTGFPFLKLDAAASIEKGIFADVKRPKDGGKGLAGVVVKDDRYFNPFIEAMKGRVAE